MILCFPQNSLDPDFREGQEKAKKESFLVFPRGLGKVQKKFRKECRGGNPLSPFKAILRLLKPFKALFKTI